MKKKIVIGVVSFIAIVSVGLTILLLQVSPVQLKRQTFNFQVNDVIPTTPETYINANENVLKGCKVNIEQVDATIIAVYPAYIEYQNKQYSFQIMIEDKKIPEVSLKDKNAVIKCFVGASYIAGDLVNVDDDSETKIYFTDKNGSNETESIVLDKEGSYDYFIYAIDSSNNYSTKVRVHFEVEVDNVGPTLAGIGPKTIKVGDDFDPLAGVSAIDNADGDITAKITVEGKVNTNKVGQYRLIYSVLDACGNRTRESRLITVTDGNNAGQVDVGDGPFLTNEQLEQRDAIVEDLMGDELDFFSDQNFINALNHYLVTHFSPSSEVNDKSSYAVIVKEKGNRIAMARAVKVFLDERGLENTIVVGTNEGMAWNIVKIDGVYRHLDVYANAIGANEKQVYLHKTKELDKAYAYDTSMYPNCD